jgi:transcriptional regulator with XRE-family HTH domain
MPGGRLCPACRHTLLSRYNKQPLCGPCTRAAKTAPHREDGYEAPAWLWDSSPWRDALARADLPAAVAVFRAASGLSQHQLAAITGWSQGTVSFFESGQRETLYDIREFLRFADAVDIPREALLPLVVGRADAALPDDWYAQVTLADVGVLEEPGVDVDRRTFGGLAAGAAASVMLPEISVPSRVTASHVRYLQTCVDRLYSRDLAIGGAALLKQAFQQWRRARRMLDESDYSEAVGRDLLLVTADLAECAGWLAADGANRRLALSMYGEASLLAGNAGDPIRSVVALARMSGTCAYMAHLSGGTAPARESLRLAAQAAEQGRYLPFPRLHAQIALRHASAASVLGDEQAFRTAIMRARRELDRGPRDDEPVLAKRISESEITLIEAHGHVSLGDPDGGIALYRRVLDDELSPVGRAFSGAHLAKALLDRGAMDDAIGAGMDVLPTLANGVTSIRSLDQLRPVRVAAKGPNADEFRARFDEVARQLSA